MKVTSGMLLLLACAWHHAAFAQTSSGTLPAGVIASQGGVQVTMQDIDAYAQRIPEADRPGYFDNPTRIQNTIMALLLNKQLAAEARAAHLDKQPLVELELAQSADEALAREAVNHYRSTLKLPDFAPLAQEYYLGHKSEFLTKGRIDVQHVLVSSKDRTDAEAKARIAEVEAAAKAHPDQFDALVEKYSDDPSKSDNHGMMQDTQSGKFVAPFADAAKTLKKPGDISPVVKTEYGYHVLKLVSHEPDVQRSFADVRDAIITKLRTEYIERETKDHINQLRGGTLDADPEQVAAVRTRFLPAGTKLPSEIAEEANEAARRKAAEKPAH